MYAYREVRLNRLRPVLDFPVFLTRPHGLEQFSVCSDDEVIYRQRASILPGMLG